MGYILVGPLKAIECHKSNLCTQVRWGTFRLFWSHRVMEVCLVRGLNPPQKILNYLSNKSDRNSTHKKVFICGRTILRSGYPPPPSTFGSLSKKIVCVFPLWEMGFYKGYIPLHFFQKTAAAN